MNFLTILVIVNIIVFIYAKKELKGVKKELHQVKGELEETKYVNQEIYKWNLKLSKEINHERNTVVSKTSTRGN
jgi:hypothetical protein